MSGVDGTGTEEARFDARLARRDPDLPGLATVLDPDRLGRWARGHGIDVPGLRVDRLRYKPSTTLRAALAPAGDGPWWLLTAYSPDSWRKAGKDVRAAAGTGRTVVDGELRLLLVPAAADRALPPLRASAGTAGATTVAHNPARRAVLHEVPAGRCRKVHADPRTVHRSVRAAQALRCSGIETPALTADGEFAVTSPWVPGRPATAADAPAVVELLPRWREVDPGDLPVLGARELRAALDRAVLGTPGLDPGLTERLHRTASRWRTRAEDAAALDVGGFAHGDLSPDQFVATGAGLVVLDVDRACRAPRGWDAASWNAAVVAAGGAPPFDVPPLLLAAAALLRAPEPFRRRRPGWAGATRRLVDLAERAVAA
ncbi:hypothetical protein FHR75_003891 [Kineococcus radiotolerans]|uniref:Aminoglycoside phosphotransferase domain-containing protein n=1 Tax=Kineococcus radiotolerans TaxID=131568 RepID=A0A7W4TQF1_KINRA|nr:hypothetical protein [Kineococcus radiotolerans]MBB2903055.1 hypothetical protein [Kineococcus radiotolerans]